MASKAAGITVTFNGTTYFVSSISVKENLQSLDITTLDDLQSRALTSATLRDAAEATIDFMGYGPRARATGSFAAPGVSGLGATVVSSSTSFAVNEPVRSQATIQFRR